MPLLFIGGEKTIASVELDFELSGKPRLTSLSLTEVGKMPSFLAFDSSGSRGACVLEGQDEVAVFEIGQRGTVKELSRASCPGGPVYASWSRDGRTLYTASYLSGEARAHCVSQEGHFSAPAHCLSTGHQSHCAEVSPDGQFLLVPSKGTDSVAVVRIEQGLQLDHRVAQQPGSGARHIRFTHRGDEVFLVCENSCTLVRYAYHQGQLREMYSISTLPRERGRGDTGADIHISRDDRFLYVSTRGHDGLRVMDLTAKMPQVVQDIPTGRVPRNFCLLADSLLVCANQEDSSLHIFERDVRLGTLRLVGEVQTPEKPYWVGNSLSY